jgi:hypothetical protein
MIGLKTELMWKSLAQAVQADSRNDRLRNSHKEDDPLLRGQIMMSALPPKADIRRRHRDVSFGPLGEITSTFAEDQSWHTCPGRKAAKRSGEMPAAFRASASASNGASIGSSVSWNVP